MTLVRSARSVVFAVAGLLAALSSWPAATEAAPPYAPSYQAPVRSALAQSLPQQIPTDVPLADFSFAFGTASWAFGDIDGDGLNDLVVAPTYGRYLPLLPLQIWINQGGGRFVDRTADVIDGPVPLVNSVQVFLIADFNGDGRADVMIIQSGLEDRIPARGGTILALLSQPNGKLVDRSEGVGGNVESHVQTAAMADLNGDGTVDIVISHPCQAEFVGCGVLLLLNDGSGRFSATVAGLPGEIAFFAFPLPPEPWCCSSRPFQSPNAVGVGDLDGDGRTDLVTGSGANGDNFDNVAHVRTLRLHQQQADGSFVERARHPVPEAIKDVGYISDSRFSDNPPMGLIALHTTAVDLNGDGRPDLVVYWEGSNKSYIEILRNDGDFDFTDVTLEWFGSYETGRGLQSGGVRVVDANGDGYPDLVLRPAGHFAAEFLDRSFVFLNDGTGRLSPWTLRLNGHIPTVESFSGLLGCDPPTRPSGTCKDSFMPMLFDADGDHVPDVVLINRRDTVERPTREEALFVHTFLARGSVRFTSGSFSAAERAGSVTITVSRTPPIGASAAVSYATSNGTALAGTHYQATSGMLTFAPGEESKTFTVGLIDDTAVNASRTVNLRLLNATGAFLESPSTAVLTITNDDNPGVIAFAGASFSAAENGGAAVIEVVRTGENLGRGSTVRYTTANGTAVAGSDYRAVSGTLIFGAGETSKTFTVPVIDDALLEGDKTFEVRLAAPGAGATLGAPASAIVTVLENDTAGTFQFSSAGYARTEGAGPATITVTRTGTNLAGGVRIGYRTTGDGTATPGADFTVILATPLRTLTFGAGVTSLTFPVVITNDTLVESDETVGLALVVPPGSPAVLGAPNTAVLTIRDNDAPTIEFRLAAQSVVEGLPANVVLSRVNGLGSPVTVDVSVAGGTATVGDDYTFAGVRTVTFGVGQTLATLAVPTIDDRIAEGPETIVLGLANPGGGAVLGARRETTATIVDNDAGGVIQFAAAIAAALESATTVTLRVTRTGANLAANVTVAYAVIGGTATPGADYTGGDGTLTFGAGETTKTIPITLVDDGAAEGDETVMIRLSSPTGGATLGPVALRTATLTIRDDEQGFGFSAATYVVSEGLPSIAIPVTRTGPTPAGTTVTCRTVDGGTAVAGVDYTSVIRTLAFTAGARSVNCLVPIVTANTVVDGSRTVNLALSVPDGSPAVLRPQRTAVLTINDNDAGGIIRFAAPSYTVPEGGTAPLVMQRSGANLASNVTVEYAVTDGTATGGGTDYTLATGTLTFAAGVNRLVIPVPTVDDRLVEGAETIVVALRNPTGGATLDPVRATTQVTITDNDVGGTIQFRTATQSATEATGVVGLVVTRTGANLAGNVTVDFDVVGGTATRGVDYIGGDGTLTFGPGDTSKLIPITIVDDGVTEGAETVVVRLSDPTGGATLGTLRTTTLTIRDNAALTSSIADTVGAVYLHPTGLPGHLDEDGDEAWDMGRKVWWIHEWSAFDTAKSRDLSLLRANFAGHPRTLVMVYFPVYLADETHGGTYLARLATVIDYFAANGLRPMLFFGRPEFYGGGTSSESHDPVSNASARAYLLGNIARTLRYGSIAANVDFVTLYYLGRRVAPFCPKTEADIHAYNVALRQTINAAGKKFILHVDGPFWEEQHAGGPGVWTQCGYTPFSIAASSGASDGLFAESWVQDSLKPGVTRLLAEERFTRGQILLMNDTPNCDMPDVTPMHPCATSPSGIDGDTTTWFDWMRELELTSWSVWAFSFGGAEDVNVRGDVRRDGTGLTRKGELHCVEALRSQGAPVATAVIAPPTSTPSGTAAGTVTIAATACADGAVTSLEITIDGVVATSNTGATSLTYAWDTTTVANGPHAIISTARDAAGHVVTSRPSTITVSNGP